jgi:hypothetical protein
MSAAQQRERAIQAAKTDFRTGRRLAREVSEPWFRAQALAWVARFGPEEVVERVAEEALKAAGLGRDAYQQVGAGAWAVRALAERGRIRTASDAASGLAELSAGIEHPVSRLNALFLLWQAAQPLDRGVRQMVLSKLVAACHSAASWQAGRTLYATALILAAEEPEEARRIVEQMAEGRYRRQAQRHLAEGNTLGPRPFFW